MSDTRIIKTDIDWTLVKNECRTTVNKDSTDNIPSDNFKRSLLISEHSPIRIMSIHFSWDSIKSWVATHFARHWLGWDKWIGTQRTDRTNVDRDKAPQDTLVRMHVKANPQALINVGRFRLCYQASPETREKMEDLKETIYNEVDSYISDVIVPNCIYRMGCPEFNTCGYLQGFINWIHNRYPELNDNDLFDIQLRYELYNEYFISKRKN